MSELRILGICGSLRKASYNRRLLAVAREELPEGAQLEVADLAGIPIYDGDVEKEGLPASVQRLKQQIRSADALLIVSPEYNYSIPGVLKNAIDWCSRPPQENPFREKPLAIMGASAGLLGSSRAQYHLRQVAVSLDMHVLNRPEVMVGQVETKFDAEGKLTDAKTRELVHRLMVALAGWTLRLRVE
jgi:chromate reductase